MHTCFLTLMMRIIGKGVMFDPLRHAPIFVWELSVVNADSVAVHE